jgi:hypothetical protein
MSKKSTGIHTITSTYATVPSIKKLDSRSLREWWHLVLGKQGKYACYAIFIGFPSDKELQKYLVSSVLELDHMSGENCLIIALSDISFIGFESNSAFWWAATEEHITSGKTLEIADLFGIAYTNLPCVLFFEDIRSAKHIALPLYNLKSDEIREKMRDAFTIIQKAISEKQNPLLVLSKHQKQQGQQKVIANFRESLVHPPSLFGEIKA